MPNDSVPQIQRIPRDEFIWDRWDYRPGEHVTFLAPTGNGKTTLAYDLIEQTATPELPAISLVMKPRDATVEHYRRKLKHRRVKNWPPTPSLLYPSKPNGFMVWPRHTFEPQRDNYEHSEIFRRAILDSYKRGDRIVFADELYGLSNECMLNEELIALWSRGRSMGAGLWGATQKPTHVPLWAYNQATHLFLSYDPDKRARDRYREIAGMNPKLIESATQQLEEYEWCYVRLAGRRSRICIVGA